MMSPEQFRAWRKALGWKQKEAAERLGLRKRMIQYYEKGNRDGKDVRIPKTVRLACYALAQGIDDFDGDTVAKIEADAAPKVDSKDAKKATKVIENETTNGTGAVAAARKTEKASAGDDPKKPKKAARKGDDAAARN